MARADGFFKANQYDKAEIEYKNVLQSYGLDPHAIARLGGIYLEQGRIGPAGQMLTKAIELQPDNAELRVKLGLCFLATDRIDEARNAAVEAMGKGPVFDDAVMLLAEASQKPKDIVATRGQLKGLANQNAAVLCALALLDVRESKLKEAEALLFRARESDPKFGPVHAMLGSLYAIKKDNVRAEQAFATSAAAAPLRSAFRIQHAQFNLQLGQVVAAKKILEEAIKNAPDFIAARILLASVFGAEKNFDEGLANVEKVLALDGTHPRALLLAAQLRLAKGDKEKAIITLETAVRLYPEATEAHYRLGTAYFSNGEMGKAAASLAQAISVAPSFAETILPVIALAELNIRQNNFGTAIASLKQLLGKNPSLVDAQLLLATAYRLDRNLPDALAAYRQLITIDPKNLTGHLFSGIILMQQGKTTEARTALTVASELAPEDLAIVEQLVTIDIFEKKYAESLERVNRLIARSPNQGRLQVLLARVHASQSNFAAAETDLRKAIELQPDSLDPYFALVQLLVSTNQGQKAFEDLRRAAEKNPKDIRPPMMLAALHEQQKDFAAAQKNYEKVLEIDPKVAAAANNLAYIYSEYANDQDKALELAQRARDLLPNQWETADTLGWVLYKRRQPQRALLLLEEAGSKNPENAELKYHLGMAYYMAGDEAKSRVALERAIQLNKTFAGAEEAAQALALLDIDPANGNPGNRAKLEEAAAKRKDDAVVFSRLGQLYELEGNRDKAMAAYSSALKASSGHAGAMLGQIRLTLAKGETAKALEMAKAARKTMPSDARIAHVLGRLSYESGEFLAATTLLQDAVRQMPGDAAVLYDLAEASYSVGRVTDAQTAMRDALEKSPEFANAAKARAFLAMEALAENPSAAAGAMSKIDPALAANPLDVPALMAKGAAFENKGDIEAAKKLYLRALARFPDFSPAKKRLAILYSTKVDDDRKGLEFATKAREAFPDDAELARAFGIISFRLENYSRSASLLAESARSRTTDAELFYYLGMSQQKLKNPAAAQSLQKAIELGLSGTLAVEAKKALVPAK